MATLGWVAADWSIDNSNNIRYIGDAHGGANPSYVTVIDFHRNIQDLADDPTASGDDLMDITKLTPTDRSTDNIITMLNGYNIDDTAAEHLYDGSIIQAGGDTIYDGVVNFGNVKYIILHQNGLILNDTTDFWNSYAADATADYKFPPNNTQPGVSHNFLVKVRDAGSDIDGRFLVGLSREFGNSYAEFTIQGTSRGNNVLALSETGDVNNATAAGTVATYDQFVNTEGYDNTNDVDPTVTTEEYYTRWNIGGFTTPAAPTINDLYEYSKWQQRRGTTQTLYGMDGDLFRGPTHQVTYTTLTNTFVTGEFISINGVAQAARVLADNGTDTMWIQLLKLSTTITGALAGATATATTNVVTPRTPSPISIGQSTGSAIIGAYGIGILAEDLTSADALTDLSEQAVTPPNNVTFGVSGLVVGEDRVLVAPRSGATENKAQLVTNATYNTAGVSQIQFTTSIPTDIEATGTFRLVNDAGYEVLLNYTGVTQTGANPRDTFNISPSYNFNGSQETAAATAGAGAFITYIDKLAASATESFTVVYAADRDLFIRVRDGGVSPIKTVENNTVTLGDTSQAVGISRQADE